MKKINGLCDDREKQWRNQNETIARIRLSHGSHITSFVATEKVTFGSCDIDHRERERSLGDRK